jgi:hypothetical protein
MKNTPALLTESESRRLLSQCSDPIPTSLSRAEARLVSMPAAVGEGELMACLTLVAPSGMTAEDRKAWVQVARHTLSGIPGDLLARGCKKARETCRFASEIVPTILADVKEQWDWRKQRLAEERRAFANRDMPRLERPRNERWVPLPGETKRILQQVREQVERGE